MAIYLEYPQLIAHITIVKPIVIHQNKYVYLFNQTAPHCQISFPSNHIVILPPVYY